MGEKRGRVYLRHLSLLFPLVFLVACSDDMLSLFFDIPPPSEEERLAEAQSKVTAEREAAQI